MSYSEVNFSVVDSRSMQSEHLPRLLYIGDVSVELSHAGSTLLYRLFEKYPADKLMIMQTVNVSGNRRLNVPYTISSNKILIRINKTRLHKWGSLLEFISAGIINRQVKQVIENYRPEAIITVTTRLSWILAYQVAKKYRLPLHLILHDDVVTGENHGRYLKNYLEKYFRQAYVLAASRFCISPNMESYYFENYGVRGTVLYPMRGYKDEVFSVSEDKFSDKKELHFCYAGSISTPDFPVMLNQLAKVLYEKNCRLTVFCDADKLMLSKFDFLMKDHVRINKFIHPDELKKFMRQQVDVNVVFNSFELELPFRWNFSSKLVDYSSVGLPVFIWGPSSSSIVNWASKNNYDCVLTEKNPENLHDMVQTLQQANKRSQWALQMTNMGISTFGYEMNYKLFIRSLLR